MAITTYFVVQPFEATKKGGYEAKSPVQAHSADHAKRVAERLARLGGGAVAFSRSGDPTAGEYEDAVILGVYGQVPEAALESAA